MNIPQCFSQNIKDLQRALNGDGLHDSDNQPLSEDGIFGSKTYQALCRICLSTKTIRRFINVTAWVQCRTGTTADGLFGQNTRAAVIRYQSSKGLSADGIVGINTMLQLVRDYV